MALPLLTGLLFLFIALFFDARKALKGCRKQRDESQETSNYYYKAYKSELRENIALRVQILDLKKEKNMPTETNLLTLFDLEDDTSYEVIVNGVAQRNKVKMIDGELHRWGGSRLGYTTQNVTIPGNARFKVYNAPHDDEGEDFEAHEFKDGLVYMDDAESYYARKGADIWKATADRRLTSTPAPIRLNTVYSCVGRVRN